MLIAQPVQLGQVEAPQDAIGDQQALKAGGGCSRDIMLDAIADTERSLCCNAPCQRSGLMVDFRVRLADIANTTTHFLIDLSDPSRSEIPQITKQRDDIGVAAYTGRMFCSG